MKKLFELCPGDLFKFEFDYPSTSFAVCLAIYPAMESWGFQPCCNVVYLYNTKDSTGVLRVTLGSLSNVSVLHQ